MGVSMVPADSLTRPTHGRLSTCPAPIRLCLVDEAGARAVVDLIENAADASALVATTEVFMVTDAPAAPPALAIRALARLSLEADRAAALARFAARLGEAPAGAIVHLAGSDTLIGLGRRAAREAGVADERVESELRGSDARRVQCIHCKTIAEEVTARQITCAGCGLVLDVRDHYSRRLAAYQAVWVGPGDNPALRREEA